MSKLISDSAAVEISKKVQDILRVYNIDDWQSEPYNQHQNPAERRIGTVIGACNNVMNHTGSPACLWLLCLMYVVGLYNHTAHESLNWRTPLEVYHGSTPDISAYTQFHFYEPIYYALDDSSFPSQSTEASGWWVGVADNVGDSLTYKVLTRDTHKIIHRSVVRSASDPLHQNRRLPSHGGEGSNTTFVRSRFVTKSRSTTIMYITVYK